MAKETYLISGILQSIGSKEEWEFIHWLQEAEKADLVTSWEFHPRIFNLAEPQFVTQTIVKQLKTKVKTTVKEKRILHGVSYEPDFKIVVSKKFTELFPNIFLCSDEEGFTWIDTKGAFNGPHNNSAITFPIKQKWLYQIENIFVQKLVPKKFFKSTWVPQRCTLTYKTKKPSVVYAGYKTIGEIV